MKKIYNILFLTFLLVGSASARSFSNKIFSFETNLQSSPDTVIKELYEIHENDNSPFFQTENRAALDKYFVKNLADKIWNDAVTSQKNQDVGALGFDPLYNGQDFEITDFKIAKPEIKDKKADVRVTFKNFGEGQIIVFKMISEKSGWKIEDIDYGDFTLLSIFEEPEDEDV